MKKQILDALMIIILQGILISCTAQPLDKHIHPTHSEIDYNCEVIAYGICYGIGVDGDIANGVGRNKKVLGNLHFDLSIRNQKPLPKTLLGDLFSNIIQYSIQITDVDTGVTYTEGILPIYIYFTEFKGRGYINDYYEPWGASRSVFLIKGVAFYDFQ